MAMPWQKAFTPNDKPASGIGPLALTAAQSHTFGNLLTADRSEARLSLAQAVSIYALSLSNSPRRPSKFLATQSRSNRVPSIPFGKTRLFVGPEDRLQLGTMLIDRLQEFYLRPAVLFTRVAGLRFKNQALPSNPSETAQYLHVFAAQLPDDELVQALLTSANILEAFPDQKLWRRDFPARSIDAQELVVHRLVDALQDSGQLFARLPPLNPRNLFLEPDLTIA